MTKQTSARLPDELDGDAEAVARVEGSSVNSLIVYALGNEIERARGDEDFTSRMKRLSRRVTELPERLAR